MLVVADRGIDPFAQPVTAETFGVQFPAQVAINIINNHEQEEEQQVIQMYRDGKNKDNEDASFEDSLERMKRIGGKRTGIGGFVMYQVNQFKKCRMMDHPVHPVEISIVDDGHQRECQYKIPGAVLINICIETGMPGQFGASQDGGRYKRHDEYRGNGKPDLAGIVPEFREPLLDLFRLQHPAQDHVPGYKCYGSNQQVAAAHNGDIMKV